MGRQIKVPRPAREVIGGRLPLRTTSGSAGRATIDRMSGTACRYCQQPVDDNWPVVMFRGEVARWCPSLRDVSLDATTVAHPYCFAEREGTDALSQLMPPSPGRAECGAGELTDGSGWRLLLHKLHTEVAGDVDLEFTLWFDPDATGRGGGGPGWSAKSHEAPAGSRRCGS
jgi:hypothetical protein